MSSFLPDGKLLSLCVRSDRGKDCLHTSMKLKQCQGSRIAWMPAGAPSSLAWFDPTSVNVLVELVLAPKCLLYLPVNFSWLNEWIKGGSNYLSERHKTITNPFLQMANHNRLLQTKRPTRWTGVLPVCCYLSSDIDKNDWDCKTEGICLAIFHFLSFARWKFVQKLRHKKKTTIISHSLRGDGPQTPVDGFFTISHAKWFNNVWEELKFLRCENHDSTA